MEYRTLGYELQDHVARITLNRPDAGNALDGEMGRELMHAAIRSGLSPDGGSTFFLPRIVGLRRALELALTTRVLTAREAQEWGLVTRVVPDAALAAEAQTLAAQLAAGATGAFGAAKRLLHHSSSESLETQMELEAQAIAERSRGADAREGIAAFIAERAPRFGGE